MALQTMQDTVLIPATIYTIDGKVFLPGQDSLQFINPAVYLQNLLNNCVNYS